MGKPFAASVSLLSVLCLASFVSLVSGVSAAHAHSAHSVGNRPQGMGGAFTAVADDATASWWNPAGLAGGAFFNALIEVDRPDTATSDSVRGVAISYPALGLTYYRLPLRQIRESTSTGSSATSRQQDA